MNQLQATIDPSNGYIVISCNGNVLFGLPLKEAIGFVSGLSGLIAQHPQVQPPEQPQIVIAGTMPQFGGRINGSVGHS